MKSNEIIVLDSGIANVGSVFNALQWLNVPVRVSQLEKEIMEAPGLIFPGVGSFDQGTAELKQKGLDIVVKKFAESNKPFLGICLGMQLLFQYSEEGGKSIYPEGLSLLPGGVRRFPTELPVPHVGWNTVHPLQGHPLFTKILPASFFYFTHSFYVAPARKENILATTEYGDNFASAVVSGNLMGVQFHPEKSGPSGLQLLRNFAEIVYGHRQVG